MGRRYPLQSYKTVSQLGYWSVGLSVVALGLSFVNTSHTDSYVFLPHPTTLANSIFVVLCWLFQGQCWLLRALENPYQEFCLQLYHLQCIICGINSDATFTCKRVVTWDGRGRTAATETYWSGRWQIQCWPSRLPFVLQPANKNTGMQVMLSGTARYSCSTCNSIVCQPRAAFLLCSLPPQPEQLGIRIPGSDMQRTATAPVDWWLFRVALPSPCQISMKRAWLHVLCWSYCSHWYIHAISRKLVWW